MKEEKRKLYILISPDLPDNNVDFKLFTEEDILEIEKEFESIYDYMDARPDEFWQELPITVNNMCKINELLSLMHGELKDDSVIVSCCKCGKELFTGTGGEARKLIIYCTECA